MKLQKGQTLLEVLIALGLLSIIMSSLIVVILSALNNANFGKNQNLATQYAQEGMEIMRNIRDQNYGTFSSLAGTYCIPENCHDSQCFIATPCTVNIKTEFVRKVTINRNAAVCGGVSTKSTLAVSWNDGKCKTRSTYCHNVTLTSCLSSLDVQPAP